MEAWMELRKGWVLWYAYFDVRLIKLLLLIFILDKIQMKGMSILPSDTIRNHQTNNSTSKNAYQFSK